MGRLVVILLIVVALVWLLRRAFGSRPEGEPGAAPELIRCARCGTHVPRSEARVAQGRLYCSDDHARLGPGSD